MAVSLAVPLGFLGSAADPVSIVVVTIVLAFVTLVLGELAPKRIAMQRAEGWSLLVARPLDSLSAFSRPAVWLLGKATDMIVRFAGGDPRARREILAHLGHIPKTAGEIVRLPGLTAEVVWR